MTAHGDDGTRGDAPSSSYCLSGKRIIQHDRVITIRTGGNQCQLAAGEFLDRAQIRAGGGRKLVPVADAGGGFLPAGEFQVDRLALVPAVGVELGQFAALATVFLGDAQGVWLAQRRLHR
jgi:hypothetical protein